MKKSLITALLLLVTIVSNAQWQPAGDKIKTPWAEKVNPSDPLPEYPRPLVVRDRWISLNGLWNYSIVPFGEQPVEWQGEILVPFCAESSLSGVGCKVGKEFHLWYSRSFTIPTSWSKERIILHFGAVDWDCDVWVNDIKVCSHQGGYTPFSADITDALIKGNNTLRVRVWDPSDSGWQPRGKQVSEPKGIWYTSVTGIWQTVWMEPVPARHITGLRTTPDLDKGVFRVKAPLSDHGEGIIVVSLFDNGIKVASGKAIAGNEVEIALSDPKLWSPDSPFLYDMEVVLLSKGKRVDAVRSYAAMRKIAYTADDNGIMRMELNNKPLFHFGLLDQGWWPDGLYTAPTDEALAFDVIKTKELGFNMIRKHVKVEPARWYYHCDRLGVLVWQDMPSGDKTPKWDMTHYFNDKELVRNPESEAGYRKEWREIMDYLHSYPSIVMWVPFNEGWGQFKTCEIAEWTKRHDPSRLVNAASGGNHFMTGDVLDLHHYPTPKMYLYDAYRVNVMGEYGGIGWPLEGHLWEPDRNWGYIRFNSSSELTDEYVKYAEMLYDMIARGFSGAIYTQTTDVEIEVNGLMTYDRKVIKPDAERIRAINLKITCSLDN
jgi:beta-galactosidase/beta-glucuronidase